MLLLNIVRVLLAGLWTAVVGIPLLMVICTRYWGGLIAARFQRQNVLDRVLERNAVLASWVSQQLWSRPLLRLVRIGVRARERAPVDWSTTHVICANHASIFDILALMLAVPPPIHFVAKRELLKWPIIGWSLKPAGQIVVDRARHTSAVRTLAEAARHPLRGQVIFFVEGTRTRTGELLPFKKGAFHFAVANHLPVLPTAIVGSFAALAKQPWWRLHPGREIEIVFGAPLATPVVGDEAAAAAAVEQLLATTREQIAATLAEAR